MSKSSQKKRDERRRLPVLMHSQTSLRTFRKCPHLYKLSYLDMYRPVQKPEPLRFGSTWHAIREVYWTTGLSAALESIQSEDIYEYMQLVAMLLGYNARWNSFISSLDILGIEAQFQTGNIHGVFDGIVRERGRLWVVEEKTAKGDLEPESPYWARLEVDPQCSVYFDAAQKMYGQLPDGIMYFVTVKPSLRPLKKSANIKLKKDGTPYANQRLDDESPEEFRERLLSAMVENPEKYFHMVRVPRLSADIQRARQEVADTMHDIDHARITDRFSRNSDACIHPFGGACSFLPVCAGRADINDPMLYTRKAS